MGRANNVTRFSEKSDPKRHQPETSSSIVFSFSKATVNLKRLYRIQLEPKQYNWTCEDARFQTENSYA